MPRSGCWRHKEGQKQKIQPVTLMNVSYVLRGAGVTIQITTRKIIKATLLAVNRVELKKRGGVILQIYPGLWQISQQNTNIKVIKDL